MEALMREILVALIVLCLCSSTAGGGMATPDGEQIQEQMQHVPQEPVRVVVEEKESNVKWLIGVIAVPILAAVIPIIIMRKKKS
jgi:hypothetical protein